jgi:hypothetical protein
MRRAKPVPLVEDLSRHIFAKLPRCKACGSADLRATRTLYRGDDGATRYVRCRKCGARYVLVLD